MSISSQLLSAQNNPDTREVYSEPAIPKLQATDWYWSGVWSVRNQAAQEEVSSGPGSEASSVFAAAPQC